MLEKQLNIRLQKPCKYGLCKILLEDFSKGKGAYSRDRDRQGKIDLKWKCITT